ncbi:RNA-directed DNA polymerase, partial [Campylobacter sp. JMF_06 NA1]|uniref:reverse transcriptase family protein n=1 Tax=Campylobacter sp. JMF_06 NA1 TaxID=2983823 RepID=UPI0022E9FAB9
YLAFPTLSIQSSILGIGNESVTKFDLLKGFWQVPLTDRAKEISAFVTPDGLFQYKVMPFGMKNSPATFQRLINSILAGLDNCKAYIDDVIIYTETFDDHLRTIRAFFDRLTEAMLTINLEKSEFCHATLTFLGHVVGQGQVKPVDSKVQAISEFPKPNCKRQLMRFLGMAGYYRKFCSNFSVIAEPLTNLLRKGTKFVWNDRCQIAFDKLKAILKSTPVLLAPDFNKCFKLAVDASDVGAGAVLIQEDDNGIDHPVCYFSKKFNTQ